MDGMDNIQDDFDGFDRDDPQLTQNSMRKMNLQTSNSTMNSMGTNNIVICRCDDLSFLHNPLNLSKAIKSSLLQPMIDDGRIKEVRTNKKKNLIVLELSETGLKDLDAIINMNQIGPWKIQVDVPHMKRIKIGVISPIDVNMDLEELKEYMEVKHNSINNHANKDNIIKIERLKRKNGNEWVDSLSVKITFRGEQLPKAVTVCQSYYRVRPYVGIGLQCFKCQVFGHTAEGELGACYVVVNILKMNVLLMVFSSAQIVGITILPIAKSVDLCK